MGKPTYPATATLLSFDHLRKRCDTHPQERFLLVPALIALATLAHNLTDATPDEVVRLMSETEYILDEEETWQSMNVHGDPELL